MQKPLLAALFLASILAIPATAAPPHHRLHVEIDPVQSQLRVVDEIRLPAALAGREIDFLLNRALTLDEASVPLENLPLGDVAPFFSINAGGTDLGGVELARYRCTVPADGALTLRYSGKIGYGLGDLKEEYTRGFRETPGHVGNEGVFLAGTTFWVPRFDDGFLTFELETRAPAGWHLISQGAGSSGNGDGIARWVAADPMEEVYLVGGPLEVARESAGAVELSVYLRQRDDALAAKYLETGAQYLEMYRELLGPYPYEKFAVVENFWETGYGMPSFTLLGPTVIRFPFILHSSYPHEILHNWWGNSVYVALEGGNWCEGLTAYLADHLIQEQRGKGAEHRRSTLQKYRDYVKAGRDFPLREFRSRHSAATEAVGYGKTLMGFHALRRQLGDEKFVEALHRLYRDQRGRRASFGDLEKVFNAVSGRDLRRFFADWIERPGAARLGVEIEAVRETTGGFVVAGRLEQRQDGEPFALEVPVVIETTTGPVRSTVTLDARNAPLTLEVAARPLALHVDPDFDLFRWLDPRETPPSIGQIFGEPEILALLPAAEGAEQLERYRGLIAAWKSDDHEIEARLDTEIERLPAGRAIWLLGRENRFAGELFEAAGVSLHLQGETVPFAGHSLVLIRRHPENVEKAVGWLVVEPVEAFPGMARKLPHYGKYSYLGFEGTEPTNTVKGEWPADDSPLHIDLRPAGERGAPLPALAPEKRRALAELPPVFSQKALAAHVGFLAAPEREGRGLGSRGLAEAAEYVARQLEAAGVKPGVGEGYLQTFNVPGPEGRQVEVANVIGVVPGTREDWREQSVVVSAHLDHLGRGWPDVHHGDEGKVHPGADDNASGVAVLLELARVFGAGERPARSVVFIAFTAEEAGRLGSKHFAEHPTPLPLSGLRAAVNLDAVGRLGSEKLGVLGGSTADEWPHVFRGCSFVTGVESRMLPGSAEGSDQWSLIEKGIPAVQITTGPHPDYHRPGDTVEKVDLAGLVKVATFVKEAVAYLAERPEPLNVTIAGSTPAASATPAQGRRVSLGTVPDFAFAGPGVRLGGVVPGSPAEKAGLAEGDVLLRLDDQEIADLRAFSERLKTLSPGQTVRVTVRRGEEELSFEVTVVAR